MRHFFQLRNSPIGSRSVGIEGIQRPVVLEVMQLWRIPFDAVGHLHRSEACDEVQAFAAATRRFDSRPNTTRTTGEVSGLPLEDRRDVQLIALCIKRKTAN